MKQTRKPIYVLGTGLSHDGSACLLKDGRISVAIEKERVSRFKHDGGNDNVAIQYCLDAEGITMSDISLIVQNANFGMFETGNEWFRGTRLVKDDMPVVSISHHLAHAYSAFATSPFSEAAVLVIDGCGNCLEDCMDLSGAEIPDRPSDELASVYFEKDSYYLFGSQTYTPVYKDFSPWGMGIKGYQLYPGTTRHSIGGVYSAASSYMFGGMDDSGKLMGLAPYGRAGIHDFPIFDLKDGRVFVRYDWMKAFNSPLREGDDFKSNFQHYADLAYWVQREVERGLIYLVRSRYEFSPSPNLCYSGGVALNAVANRRILTECPFQNLFIQPAAGDNGLALGAAFYGWMEVLKQDRVLHDGATRFGKIYPARTVETALSRFSDRLQVTFSENMIDETAECLASGQVVGWFQGRAEFGPRALGGRSILADSRSPNVRDHINARIKFREDFRPFAPSLPLEDVSTYFDCDYASPYMLLVAPVRPEWAQVIPSVVHQDGSARIQTVTEADDPTYYGLLKAFKNRTGISVLLNTSFNKRGTPIVETPEQAIEFFLAYGLDTLVIGDYVVKKQPAPVEDQPKLPAIFNRLGEALQRNWTPAAPIQAKLQINVPTLQSWAIDIGREGPRIEQGNSVTPDMTIECAERDLRVLVEDPSDAGNLLKDGRLRVTGNLILLAQFVRLLIK